MNTFNCIICKCEVSKRQSVSFKDGRACRHHPEVIELLNQQRQKELDRINKEQEKNKPREYHQPISPLVPHCWLCMKEGIQLQEVYYRQLVGMAKVEEKQKVTGEKMNFFEMMNRTRKESGVEGKIILFTFQNLSEFQRNKLTNVNFEAEQLINLTNSVVICQLCMKAKELEYKNPTTTIDPKQLLQLGSIYEVTMKPSVVEIAKSEIAVEATQN